MSTIASLITSITIVYSTIYSGADQSKHQSSASLAFVWGIHRGPVNSPHKWPVTRKMFPFDDVIMGFPYHCGLATPTGITAHAWRTCRDACRNHQLAVSFEGGGGENAPGIPDACATGNFIYLVRGPLSKPIMSRCWPLRTSSIKFESKQNNIRTRNFIWKYRL